MTTSLPLPALDGATALVAGGTGNVGFFAVDALLRAGADVLVPTRSNAKFDRLLSRLAPELRDRLSGLPGDISTPEGAREIAERAETRTFGGLDAVVSTVASWHQGPPVLSGGYDAFREVIESTLYPHFVIAEALVPVLKSGGSYTTVNGPVGFTDSVHSSTGPIAAATAAQNRLVLAIADETGGDPRVNDMVMWAYLGPNGTRAGSPLQGEEVGAFLAWLASPDAQGVHGRTIHLRTPDQVRRVLAGAGQSGDLG
ncbi:SDR family oxidoreductase [Streptomyces hyaluromycini]|uniref:SDR family oxidoreductase n=1 Tax=Streptomyces hyaluromycini TaxID=1377993 RepID=A0ABV1WTX9_9ACTN